MSKLLDFENLEGIPSYDLQDGSTLAVGEHEWLLSVKGKPHQKDEVKDRDALIDLIDHHLGIEVQYCPILPGDCVTMCSTDGWCGK